TFTGHGDNVLSDMNQNIHTVRWPSGHWACIHLEPEFWDLFRLATIERGTTIGRLLAEVDRTHRLLPYQGRGTPRVLGLSAAVRVFVLREVMTKLARAEAQANRRAPLTTVQSPIRCCLPPQRFTR